MGPRKRRAGVAVRLSDGLSLFAADDSISEISGGSRPAPPLVGLRLSSASFVLPVVAILDRIDSFDDRI